MSWFVVGDCAVAKRAGGVHRSTCALATDPTLGVRCRGERGSRNRRRATSGAAARASFADVASRRGRSVARRGSVHDGGALTAATLF